MIKGPGTGFVFDIYVMQCKRGSLEIIVSVWIVALIAVYLKLRPFKFILLHSIQVHHQSDKQDDSLEYNYSYVSLFRI